MNGLPIALLSLHQSLAGRSIIMSVTTMQATTYTLGQSPTLVRTVVISHLFLDLCSSFPLHSLGSKEAIEFFNYSFDEHFSRVLHPFMFSLGRSSSTLDPRPSTTCWLNAPNMTRRNYSTTSNSTQVSSLLLFMKKWSSLLSRQLI